MGWLLSVLGWLGEVAIGVLAKLRKQSIVVAAEAIAGMLDRVCSGVGKSARATARTTRDYFAVECIRMGKKDCLTYGSFKIVRRAHLDGYRVILFVVFVYRVKKHIVVIDGGFPLFQEVAEWEADNVESEMMNRVTNAVGVDIIESGISVGGRSYPAVKLVESHRWNWKRIGVAMICAVGAIGLYILGVILR